jgi:hypothetical protein
LTLLLYISFPLLCVLSIPMRFRPGALAERVVLGLALYEFLLLAIGLSLGVARHLTPQNYAILTWSAAIPLALQSWWNGVRLDFTPLHRWLRTGRGAASLGLVALLGCAFAVQLGFDALYGTRHSDGLWYHIPRISFWIQQHSFDPWTTPVWAQIGHPVGADVVLGQKILLGSGWRGIAYVTALLSIGAIACVYVAALDLGLKRWHAVMAAVLFASFPAVGLRIWSVNSDIAAAFPVLAAFVSLHRLRRTELAIAAFLVFNGVAVACKLTIAAHALIIGAVGVWQCRYKIIALRSFGLPCAGVLLAAVLALSSHWPVYAAFSDFLAGDGGRDHKTISVSEFTHATAISTGHWLLEPLAYVAPIPSAGNRVKDAAKAVYNLLGEHFDELPDSWKPWPAQDMSHSGLAAVVFLPVLLLTLPLRARLPATLLFLLAFISLSGMLRFNPYTGRFFVLLLAGYALIWTGTRLFSRGYGRWVLTGLVALNACALVAVVALRATYVDIGIKSQPGEAYYYLADEDRSAIAKALSGRPLLVVTSGDSLDALLAGPEIEYPLSYLICPADGNWEQEFRDAALTSNWLAVVHFGRSSIGTGPVAWHRPGSHTCPKFPVSVLEYALIRAGWSRHKQNPLVDVWKLS